MQQLISSFTVRLRQDLAFILALRVWQASAGLVTTVLAVHYLTPELQGWYYSFLSVAALSTLFDLGLSTVLVQVAAHSFVGLRWANGNALEGRRQTHFRSLLAKSVRWYAIAALAFIGLILPGGWAFFASKTSAGISWMSCWLVLSLLSASGLLVLPFLSMVEGSGQIAQVYSVRLATSVLGSLACWMTLASGGGLWAAVTTPAMAFCIPLLSLASFHRPLVAMARDTPNKDYRWSEEIWPLQWRLGINWLCGYLLTQINTPLLFHTQGAIVAGQFGLSLTVANTIGLISQSWILRRVPGMAQAAASRDWRRLDQLFWRDFGISLGVFAAGTTAVVGLVTLFAEYPAVHRLLPWPQLLGLFVVGFISQFIGGLALHLRSFRREPLVWLSLFAALIAVPASFYAARHYSSAGVIAVMTGVNVIVNMPAGMIIWRRCNSIWRATA